MHVTNLLFLSLPPFQFKSYSSQALFPSVEASCSSQKPVLFNNKALGIKGAVRFPIKYKMLINKVRAKILVEKNI